MKFTRSERGFRMLLPAISRTWAGMTLALFVLISAIGWAPSPQGDGTTEDPSDIEILQLHLFAVVSGDRLVVREGYSIGNSGDQTYIGSEDPETGERITLTFILPNGAENLSFEDSGLGERFIEVEGGFADTQPIPPGSAGDETEFGVAFVYELPFSVGMQVERVFPVPVSAAVLLLLDEETILQGPTLFPAGGIETQMGVASSYIADSVDRGETLVFALVERPPEVPAPAASDDFQQQSPPVRNVTTEVGIGLVAVAGAAIGAFLLWRPADAGPMPAPVRPLVESIAELDLRHEDGEIEHDEYHESRSRLMREVRRSLGQARRSD